MSGVAKKLMGTTAAGGGGPLAIEDVFSCFLYTSNFSSLTLTNGINIPEFGGMTWFKPRTDAKLDNHIILDTERADTGSGRPYLITNSTAAQATSETPFYAGAATDWSSDGFKLGQTEYANGPVQGSNSGGGVNMASWTFRKAPRFFDCLTYTGNGVAGRQIPHNLGVAPGMVVIKTTNSTYNWEVWHRSLTDNTKYIRLNSTEAERDEDDFAGLNLWNQTAPTDSVFTVGSWGGVNGDGIQYVAYLFAHDPLGPSGDGSDGLIDCGSYTGNGDVNGNPGQEVELGFEPQWILSKRSNGDEDWNIRDVMRGATTDGTTQRLRPNSSAAESENSGIVPYSLGFKAFGGDNLTGATYIYIAIRRGPMRAPTSGTEVFDVEVDATSTPRIWTPNFPVDFNIISYRDTFTSNKFGGTRLTGNGKYLVVNSTNAELSSSNIWGFDADTGEFKDTALTASANKVNWMFRRAPEFFDVVAYTGDGVAGRTVPHNLGVAPEMMIVKSRNNTGTWPVYHTALGNTQHINLNEISTPDGSSNWSNQTPTDTVFYVSASGFSADVNGSGKTFIAYLFATLAGISKVGNYTGNGTSQTINCGFTSSARFIIIKRTDAAGDWYVWDTARGIVAGNDPFLELNSIAAEVTTDDSIDPASSGFIVNQTAVTDVNVNAASYIFYAVS